MLSAEGSTGPLRWVALWRPVTGELVCGDRCVVHERPGGGALIAVVDGLGHGPDAAAAAQMAITVVGEHVGAAPDQIMSFCHEALKGARGAVMSVANVTADSLTWSGIGNVQGVLLRAKADRPRRREWLFLHSGVVGAIRPKVRTASLPVDRGDLLIFATDGVRTDFADSLDMFASVRDLAESICRSHGRADDDLLIFVGRFEG